MVSRGWQSLDPEGELTGEVSHNWDLHWSYMRWAVETLRWARNLQPWQRVNHFRNSKELCRKDLMLKNLKKRQAQLMRSGSFAEAAAHEFFPASYNLPRDYALFAVDFKSKGGIWIMKPSGSSEGRGIFLMRHLRDVKAWHDWWKTRSKKGDIDSGTHPGSYVAQQYLHKPYLIGGKKFDLRLYVLVTAFQPLTVYLYRNGFARFSHQPYTADPASMGDNSIHLTNVAVQRKGEGYSSRHAGKMSLRDVKFYMAMNHGQREAEELFWQIQMIVVRTLLSVNRLIISDKQAFELYGYDIMIDDELKPWLLEVNASPSLGTSNTEDHRLKFQLMNDVFDVVDLEGQFTQQGVREQVGGFDLIYHCGYVEAHPDERGAPSYLGCVHKNRIKRSQKSKGRVNEWYKFPRETCQQAATAKEPMWDTTEWGSEQWRSDTLLYPASSRLGGLKEITIDYPEDCSWRPGRKGGL
ncbi:unnamed protein product [Chrysoparadoxa australica]